MDVAGRWAGGWQRGGMKARPGKRQLGFPKASLLVLGAAQLSCREMRELEKNSLGF